MAMMLCDTIGKDGVVGEELNDIVTELSENIWKHLFNSTLLNKWQVLPRIGHSFQLACLGIEARQPTLEVHKDFFAISFETKL